MPLSEKLRKTLEQINKVNGADTITTLENTDKFDVEILCSSGSTNLDLAMGGGFPKGRMVEIFGPESSGKTTLAIHAIADTQAKGGVAAFIDMEHAFSPEYAEALGVNLTNLLFSQPANGEQALDIMQALGDSGEVNLIILDSVAAMVPKKELEGAAGDLTVGLAARLMGQALRKLSPICGATGTCVIFINQIREKIGVMYGSPETTPGGNALKFYASIRLDIRRIERVKSDTKNTEGRDEFTGNVVRVKCIKNKIAPPFKEAEFVIIYGEGISKESEIITASIKLDILKKTGKGVEINFDTLLYDRDIAIGSTVEKTVEILRDEELFAPLFKEISFRLQVGLGNEKLENLQPTMAAEWSKANKNSLNYKENYELGSKASGLSKLVEAKYYLTKAIVNKFWSKEAKTKLLAVEKRIQEKMNKGEKINWVITVGDLLVDVETGEETPVATIPEAVVVEEPKTE